VWPSALGNHAIGAIEIPKDYESSKLRSTVVAKSGRRYLIVDPTSERTPYGQLESGLQGGFGVLVEGKDSEVIALPVLSPELNTISRSARFKLDSEGSLKRAITERRFGDLSSRRRYLYTAGDAQEQKRAMDRTLSRRLGAARKPSPTHCDKDTSTPSRTRPPAPPSPRPAAAAC
jgi:hypothetical protein